MGCWIRSEPDKFCYWRGIMKLYFVLAGVLLAGVNASAVEVYRWVDMSGKVHYGDIPSQESVQVEKMQFGDKQAEDETLPYEARQASKNFPVVLYVSGNCGNICVEARDLLNKRGIPFSERLLNTKEGIDSFKTLSGGEIVPTISVGKSWIRGFQAEKWNSELDVAGYPRTALPRNPSAKAGPPVPEPATEEEPAAEEPGPEEPAAEEPANEEPSIETPAVEVPAAEQ
jgi:hypothetical protein